MPDLRLFPDGETVNTMLTGDFNDIKENIDMPNTADRTRSVAAGNEHVCTFTDPAAEPIKDVLAVTAKFSYFGQPTQGKTNMMLTLYNVSIPIASQLINWDTGGTNQTGQLVFVLGAPIAVGDIPNLRVGYETVGVGEAPNPDPIVS